MENEEKNKEKIFIFNTVTYKSNHSKNDNSRGIIENAYINVLKLQ
jgi:hypothetical protein